MAREEGLPFSVRKKTYNSRLAHELGKWAETKGKGMQFHDAAFRAFFVDGKNIGRIDELVDLAKSVGLSQRDARDILDTRAFKEPVDQDWAHSEKMKIKVVPTLLINQSQLRGAHSYDKMEQFLMDNDIKRRNQRTDKDNETIICPSCDGHGYTDADDPACSSPCIVCGGSGWGAKSELEAHKDWVRI